MGFTQAQSVLEAWKCWRNFNCSWPRAGDAKTVADKEA